MSLCLVPVVAAAVLGVAGGGSGAPSAPAGLSVVASTDVHGAVATAVDGPDVHVTSLINSPDADPHEYESTPAYAVAVGKAVVVYHGAGYDDFAPKMLRSVRREARDGRGRCAATGD